MALISRSTLKTAAKGLAVIIIMLVAWEIAAIAIDNNYILAVAGKSSPKVYGSCCFAYSAFARGNYDELCHLIPL